MMIDFLKEMLAGDSFEMAYKKEREHKMDQLFDSSHGRSFYDRKSADYLRQIKALTAKPT